MCSKTWIKIASALRFCHKPKTYIYRRTFNSFFKRINKRRMIHWGYERCGKCIENEIDKSSISFKCSGTGVNKHKLTNRNAPKVHWFSIAKVIRWLWFVSHFCLPSKTKEMLSRTSYSPHPLSLYGKIDQLDHSSKYMVRNAAQSDQSLVFKGFSSLKCLI